MKTSGMNTAASEIVIERIVKEISLALPSAACQAFSPRSIRRTAFSRNTIASSIRNPIASVNAISDRLSRLYPRNLIETKVRRRDSGSATAGMRVSRARPRKRKMTATTSTNARGA